MTKHTVPPSVPVAEQPYQVPDNWRWVYLTSGFAECLDAIRKPVNTKERAKKGGHIPYYGATGQAGWIDDYLTDEQLVLLGEDGAPFLDDNRDKAYLIEGKAWINNHAHVLRSYYGSIGNHFLVHYLNSFDFTGFVNGSTRLKLTQANMNRIPIPVPPFAEQRRIVERLEGLLAKLDEARDKAQAVVDGYEYRRAALLRRAFLGALTANWRKENNLTSPWTVSQFGNLIDDAKLGLVRSRKEQFTEEKYFYLKMNNITADGFVDLSGMVYVDATRDEALLFALDYGDFLFNTRNSYELVGKNTVWTTRTCETTLFNNNIMRVRFKKGVNPFFVSYYLHSPEGKHALERLKKNTTNIAAIYAKDLNKTTIPLPPAQEQERIVDILNHMLQTERQTKESAERVLESVGLIKKAVLGRAFRGLLGTNDPTEGA